MASGHTQHSFSSIAKNVFALTRRGRLDERALAVRTRVIDERILRTVRDQRLDTVVHLSTETQTRNVRLDLPAHVQWIEADLGDVAESRRLLADLNAAAQRVLVVTEGVLTHLLPTQVEALARDLFDAPIVQCWLTDLRSPEMAGAARFAPEDPQAFFHPLGWQPMRFHSFFLEAHRLHRESPRDRCRRLLQRLVPDTWRESWRRSYGVMELRRVSVD